jgi:hypothetical protein
MITMEQTIARTDVVGLGSDKFIFVSRHVREASGVNCEIFFSLNFYFKIVLGL